MLNSYKNRSPLKGGPIVAIMGTLFSILLMIGLTGQDLDHSLETADEISIQETQLLLPIRSKIVALQIPQEQELLGTAEVNQGDRPLIRKAYAQLIAGESYPPGSSLPLRYPNQTTRKPAQYLRTPNGDLIHAQLSDALTAPSTEQIRRRSIEFSKTLENGDRLHGFVLALDLAQADITRTDVEIDALRREGANEDAAFFETYKRTAELAGFVLVYRKLSDTFLLYPVIGNITDQKLNIESSKSDPHFNSPSESYLKAVLDVVFNRRTSDEVRQEYLESATDLIDRAVRLNQSFQLSERWELDLRAGDQPWKLELQLDPSRGRSVPHPLHAIRIHNWSNAHRIDSDLQQVIAFGIQPVFTNEQVGQELGGLMISYDPHFPADEHRCAAQVLRHRFQGHFTAEDFAQFSMLYSNANPASAWELMYASIPPNDSTPSQISSWTFVPTRKDKLANQSVTSGIKVFVNPVLKTGVSRVDLVY